jgi:hypothetical protein
MFFRKPNFWYSSNAYEIFIDTDNFQRSIKHTNARLLGAIECERLAVHSLEHHKSRNENHVHTLITLQEPMPAMERYVWALILHSDIYRSASVMMRHLNNVPHPDILITPTKFKREPNDICFCKEKHNAATMEKCEAATRLRGELRITGFFGVPSKSGFNIFERFEFFNFMQSWERNNK